MSLNFLATRFQCTLAVEHAGHALRRPARLRLRRSLRPARARRRAHARRCTTSGPGRSSRTLRADLNAGGSKFCGDCPLKLPLKKDETPPVAAGRRRRRCRRGCTSSARPPATSRAPRRAARRKPASPGRARPACSTSTCSAASSTKPGPSLGRIDFFNYGEAFLHKRAVEMCEYIKTQLPAHLPLHEHQRPGAHRRAGAAAGALGHRRGDVLDRRRDAGELREVPPARQTSTWRSRTCARWPTRSARPGRDLPFLNWRYILFNWNDSDEEMARARRLAADIGVDRLCWEITDHPENAYSRRFVPGSPDARRDPPRDLGRQQPRQRDPRRDAARAHRRPHAACPALPLVGARRPAAARSGRASTTSRRAPFPAQAQLRPAARAPRRAAVRRRRHAHRPRLRARLAARTTLEPGGERGRRRSRCRRSQQPGRYTLKFDLVSEGIDWFERCGSPTTTRPLWVQWTVVGSDGVGRRPLTRRLTSG